MKSWSIIFWVTIALYLIEIVFYTIFGSGVEQAWNKPKNPEILEAQPLKSPASPKQDYETTKN